ncbi:MAG: bifunctional 5,10-methylenetetrahydrofolate dehydrogenase/5,10-methenyltetrahydrofolate cyclohydrolase [Mollicutes bacterium]|nr:bifunctional 5,10-methylenetetrahydrofolate dehydrogenase/5,10-methenyltetrahydrofolate cyclohydrolase [Mollicutes bacterium]
MQKINVKKIIENKKNEIRNEVKKLKGRPNLTIIQVEGHAESDLYVKNKIKLGKELGIHVTHIKLHKDIEKKDIIELIEVLNKADNVHGIIVQLPLPAHLNEFEIVNHIDYRKDVDGLTVYQRGLAEINGEGVLYPCTAVGVMEILKNVCKIKSMDVVIVNRSSLIGKPLQKMLTQEDATVTMCHSKTKNLDKKMRKADIIVTGVGIPKIFNELHFTDGQIIVDCSMNYVDGKIVGDVDIDKLENINVLVASGKGNTGPMTVLSLMENTIKSFKSLQK